MGDFKSPPSMEGHFQDIKRRLAELEVGKPRLYAEQLSEVTASSPAITDLGGPSIKVAIGGGSPWVLLYAQVDVKFVTGAALVHYVAPDLLTTQVLSGGSGTYTTLAVVPGSSTGIAPPLGAAITIPPTQGTGIYSLGYSSPGIATFKNRRLWVFPLV